MQCHLLIVQILEFQGGQQGVSIGVDRVLSDLCPLLLLTMCYPECYSFRSLPFSLSTSSVHHTGWTYLLQPLSLVLWIASQTIEFCSVELWLCFQPKVSTLCFVTLLRPTDSQKSFLVLLLGTVQQLAQSLKLNEPWHLSNLSPFSRKINWLSGQFLGNVTGSSSVSGGKKWQHTPVPAPVLHELKM